MGGISRFPLKTEPQLQPRSKPPARAFRWNVASPGPPALAWPPLQAGQGRGGRDTDLGSPRFGAGEEKQQEEERAGTVGHHLANRNLSAWEGEITLPSLPRLSQADAAAAPAGSGAPRGPERLGQGGRREPRSAAGPAALGRRSPGSRCAARRPAAAASRSVRSRPHETIAARRGGASPLAKAEEEGLPGQECAWERAQPARLPEEAGRDAEDERGHLQRPGGGGGRGGAHVRAGSREPTPRRAAPDPPLSRLGILRLTLPSRKWSFKPRCVQLQSSREDIFLHGPRKTGLDWPGDGLHELRPSSPPE